MLRSAEMRILRNILIQTGYLLMDGRRNMEQDVVRWIMQQRLRMEQPYNKNGGTQNR